MVVHVEALDFELEAGAALGLEPDPESVYRDEGRLHFTVDQDRAAVFVGQEVVEEHEVGRRLRVAAAFGCW